MNENTANKKIHKFDFVKPAKVEFSSGFSLEVQKKSIEKKFSETRKKHNINSYSVIISLVAVSLIGLCGYTIWQLIDTTKNNEKIALEKKSLVDNSIIIPSDTFSIVLKSNPTVKFNQDSESAKMEFLDDKKSTENSYFTTEVNNITAGIVITNAEYDNKLSQEGFTNKYMKYLGPDFDIASENTFLQRGFFTNKITPKINPDNIAFYPVVSSNNYYIIKTINPLKKDKNNIEVSNFVDELITRTYLN
jgi:hypothetical protein